MTFTLLFQLQVREDHSLVIAQVRPSSAGNYTINAENGIGTAAVKIVRVVVWPLSVRVRLIGLFGWVLTVVQRGWLVLQVTATAMPSS